MAYLVLSGEIVPGVEYLVVGTKAVLYNSITYITGQLFIGVLGFKTFTYSGAGTEEVNEVTLFSGFAAEFDNEANVAFSDMTIFYGFAIEYEMNQDEKLVNDITQINGFTAEVIDYPFYSFEITETRL